MSRRGRRRIAALAVAALLVASLAGPAAAEVARKGDLVVSFGGRIAPRKLPRTGLAPIGVSVEARVHRAAGGLPPSLRRIALDINRNGVLDDRGLPTCPLGRLRATSTRGALRACRPAQVGYGRAGGQLAIPGQRPVRFDGRVVAFNGRLANGRAAILAHLYTASPIALSFVLSFAVERTPGTFGTRLVAVVPPRTRRIAHVTRFALQLRRTYTAAGQRRSYLSAGCPAPEGFPGATFPLVRAAYGFDGGKTLSSVLVRTCRAR